jgi:regulatory protein
VLRRKEIPDEVAEQVLDRLTAVGLIDDEAYAAAFVATKHRDRGLGRSALRTELQRKGVDAQTAAAAVTVIDSDAERDRAAALIARRVDSAMAAGPDAARRRLVGLLARRGYSPSLAMAVVDEALTRYSAEEC